MPEGQAAEVRVQGFGDAIKGAPIVDAPAEAIAAAEAAPADEAGAAAAAAVETKDAADKGVEAATAQPPSPQAQGILKGLQAERAKRQQTERELEAARAELAQYTGDPGAAAAAAGQAANPQIDDLNRRFVLMSEISARNTHPDYDEKFAVFFKAAEKNPALYDTIMSSDHPGEAAYAAGKSLELQEKYGLDPDGMIKAIKKETETELRASIRKELEAELKGKIADKGNSHTHITAGRASGGDTAETVQPLGFAQVLARKPRG